MSSSNTKLLLELLDSFDCKQYVDFPSQDSGHSLDLLISRSSSRSLLSNVHPQFPALSDHYAVLATISVPTKDRPSRVTKTIRNLRSIDISSFSQDIRSSTLYTAPPTNLSDYLLQFNSILSSLLDKHAPTRTITCQPRTPKPFITPEIRAAKARRSQLETIYRKTRSPGDLARFKLQAKHVANLISSSRKEFYRNLISENAKHPRKLWKTLDKLLNRITEPKLP